jgi:hypothetical protein
VIEFQPDNYDPLDTAIMVASDKSTTVRVYRTTNLSAASPTWNLQYSISGNLVRAVLQASVYQDTWFLLVQKDNTDIFYKTTDNFATVSQINNLCGVSPFAWYTFFISNRAASRDSGLIVAAYGAGASQSHVTISRDYGNSFTPDLTWGFNDFHPPAMVYVTYENNASENIWYVMGGEDSTTDAWIVRTDDGGTYYEDISPFYDDGGGLLKYGGGQSNRYSRRYIYDYTKDSNKLAAIMWPSTQKHGARNQQVFISDDGGDNWTRQSELGSRANGIGGWPYDENILFITGSASLRYSDDRGATWSNKHWVGYSEGVWTVPIWIT